MRKLVQAGLVAVALASGATAFAHENVAESRRLEFPDLGDGRKALAIDLHTHSVFSDGAVWPSIRVEEARRDGLAAMAVTEHLEYQPKFRDIPHEDRNRSYQVASETAEVGEDDTGLSAQPLEVINGSEITKSSIDRGGHINAVFLTDANAVMGTDARAQLRAANDQGAFTFWNHPYWTAQTPDGVARLSDFHRSLIADGLLHGIEVANGADMSDEAFHIALAENLTILGTSDIHGLIDWDYDLANGAHRTVTLALAADASPENLKAALKAGETVAVFNDNLAGREENVEAVVRASLRLEVGDYQPNTTVAQVELINDSPIDFVLENAGQEGFYDEANLFRVPAHDTVSLKVRDTPDLAALSLTFRVLNAFIGPRESLRVTLRDETPN